MAGKTGLAPAIGLAARRVNSPLEYYSPHFPILNLAEPGGAAPPLPESKSGALLLCNGSIIKSLLIYYYIFYYYSISKNKFIYVFYQCAVYNICNYLQYQILYYHMLYTLSYYIFLSKLVRREELESSFLQSR